MTDPADQKLRDVIRWEYARIPMNTREDWNLTLLNELGREGWELVHVGRFVFTLKRPLREARAEGGSVKRADDPEARLRDVIEAVLLWFSPGPWYHEKADRWLELTGTRECTSKALCDWLRKVAR